MEVMYENGIWYLYHKGEFYDTYTTEADLKADMAWLFWEDSRGI